MRDEYGLTPKQRAFADYYIQTGNASEAARKAGYKTRANVMGTTNLSIHAVKAYIDKRLQPDVERRIADADEVLRYLSSVMRGEVKDQFGLEASLQERTKAAQELLKRYAVADMRQATTMQRLDSLFVEFRAALSDPDSGAAISEPGQVQSVEQPAVETVAIATETELEPGAEVLP